MSILVSLHHVTRYRYDRPVALGPHAIRLRPAPHGRTRVPSYSLKVSPEQHYVNWQHDPHGNWLARFVFSGATSELVVSVDLLADIAVVNPFDFLVEAYAERVPFRYPDALRRELGAFLELEPAGRRLQIPAPRSPWSRAARSSFWSIPTIACRATSATWCAWSPGSRSPRKRWKPRRDSA